MPALTDVDLSCKHITSEGIKRLQSLSQLTSLNLAFSRVTDEGIQQLRQLPCLRSLSLRWTSITDSALQFIAGASTNAYEKEAVPESQDALTDLSRTGSGTTPTALRRSKSDATSTSSLGLSESSPRQVPPPARSSSSRTPRDRRSPLSKSGDYARELQRCRPNPSGLCGLALVRTKQPVVPPCAALEPPRPPESETLESNSVISRVQTSPPPSASPSGFTRRGVRRSRCLPPTPPKTPPRTPPKSPPQSISVSPSEQETSSLCLQTEGAVQGAATQGAASRASLFEASATIQTGVPVQHGPVKTDGSPDMRFTANRQAGLKADGTPDMRFAANKQAAASCTPSRSADCTSGVKESSASPQLQSWRAGLGSMMAEEPSNKDTAAHTLGKLKPSQQVLRLSQEQDESCASATVKKSKSLFEQALESKVASEDVQRCGIDDAESKTTNHIHNIQLLAEGSDTDVASCALDMALDGRSDGTVGLTVLPNSRQPSSASTRTTLQMHGVCGQVAWGEQLEATMGLFGDSEGLGRTSRHDSLCSDDVDITTSAAEYIDEPVYRGLDLDEAHTSCWMETEAVYRDVSFGDEDLEAMPVEEEPLWRSCDVFSDLVLTTLNDDTCSDRSSSPERSPISLNRRLSFGLDQCLSSTEELCNQNEEQAPSAEAQQDNAAEALQRTISGSGVQLVLQTEHSWKSNSCGDIGGLMRRQMAQLADSKPSALECEPKALPGGPLNNIETLDLSVTELFGWGLQFLEHLPHLKSLNLFSTKVSDEGLVHIAGHRSLVDLNLCGTNITDMGVQHLLGLERLTELKVSGNKGITDVGAELLYSTLEALRTLETRQTSVTSGCSFHIQEGLATRGLKGSTG